MASALLKDRGQNAFQEQWSEMEPVIQRLLQQSPVGKSDWQNLFWCIHTVCLWDDKGAQKVYLYLQEAIRYYIQLTYERISCAHSHYDTLKAYAAEWCVFVVQCNYLPMPFAQLEQVLTGRHATLPSTVAPDHSGGATAAPNSAAAGAAGAAAAAAGSDRHRMGTAGGQHTAAAAATGGGGGGVHGRDSIVRKLMLDTWYHMIFVNLESRLVAALVALLDSERRDGTARHEAAALIVAVRDSCVHLSSASLSSASSVSAFSSLPLYHGCYERVYLDCLRRHYRCHAADYLHENGVHAYMLYADAKLSEEEERGRRYLEESGQSLAKIRDECVALLVTQFCDSILAECATLVERRDTRRLALMLSLLDRMTSGGGGATATATAPSSGAGDNYSTVNTAATATAATGSTSAAAAAAAAAAAGGSDDTGDAVSAATHSVQTMIDEMEKYIRSTGLAVMMANADTITQDCERFVEQMLDLYQQFSELIYDAFRNDPRFLTARDKAFKDLVNDTSVFRLELTGRCQSSGQLVRYQPESRCAELLANYCDMLLRRTPFSKRLTSDQIDAKLRSVLCLLRYVVNKDVFMRYYKMHLARRLVLNTSADSDKEECLVDWLRDIGMPADYVNKLSRMFQDIKVSNDLNDEFYRSRRTSAASATTSATSQQQQQQDQQQQVSIKILNAGAWSRATGGAGGGGGGVAVSLPAELEEFVPELEQFYRQKHSGRKLHWHHHMSNATIVFHSEVGRYDVDVTTYQLAVLFAWNGRRRRDRLSLDCLTLATQLPEAELRRTLWSLVACSRLRHQLLLYEPQVASGRDFDTGTRFWVNHGFGLVKNDRMMSRGKVSVIGRLQLSAERARGGGVGGAGGGDNETEHIMRLRVLRAQEAIVRIMKMRKTITNAQLHTELIEMLKNLFLPSRKLIKEQIEWLIDNRYMRRDDSDINKFIYMA